MTERVELIHRLLPLWYAEMAWAKELIVRAFEFEKPDDILRIRGRQPIPGTNWTLCTHGVGVDVYKTPAVGGINFDFDKPDPDVWRLQLFFEKQLNAGALDYSVYRELAEDEELLVSSIKEALNAA
jgi:hypothetical protein